MQNRIMQNRIMQNRIIESGILQIQRPNHCLPILHLHRFRRWQGRP